jgi:hypothetical protein
MVKNTAMDNFTGLTEEFLKESGKKEVGEEEYSLLQRGCLNKCSILKELKLDNNFYNYNRYM